MTAGPVEGDWRLRHLSAPLLVSGVLAVCAGVTGGVLAGAVGAVGAVAGVLLVAAGNAASTVLLARADAVQSALVKPVGMMVYVAKISVFGAVMMVAAALEWDGLIPMAWGIAAAVVGWISGHAWWLARHPPGQTRDTTGL